MGRDKKIPNALKRSEVHRKSKREKAQEKLKRRMEIKKAEKEKGTGEQLKRERLAKNVPRTLDNTRIYDSTSYLTADPASLRAAAERAAEASRKVNGSADPGLEGDEDEDDMGEGHEDEEDEDEGEDEDEDEEMPEAGPSRPSTLLPTTGPNDGGIDLEGGQDEITDEADKEEGGEEEQEQPHPSSPAPPRILITTSPSPCKSTYAFCDDLKNIFPGGEFFKRPKGRGFEIGRVARWAAKRGYGACIVVNEDHKIPNAITLMALPAGPTAYFKLTSVVLGSQIHGHARPSPHSPELILNNFTTLLGNSVGRLFGSLFPPMPMFKGRQVVTLHNQRDFLFFRRHRYMFASATSAKLQEIGPRFTLKLRWLRKGLPGVTSADGQVPRGGDAEDVGVDGDVDEGAVAREEQMDEDAAMEEMASGASAGLSGDPPRPKTTSKTKLGDGANARVAVPALDEEQEYEWKWKPKMEVSRRTFFL